jgi:hypothetical protein
MNVADEAKRLRIRETALTAEFFRSLSEGASGSESMVARTVSLGSYPTTAQSYFALNPITVLGAEVEGGSATLTAEPGIFFALNIGSTIPPTGTDLLVTFIGNRWAFRYDG